MAPAKKQPDTKVYSGRLAAQIRELREAAGLSVEAVAAAMTRGGYQISAPTLYHWENGNREPALDALPALAKALKVSLIDLFPKR